VTDLSTGYRVATMGSGIAAGDTCSGGATAGTAAYGQAVEAVCSPCTFHNRLSIKPKI